MFPWPVVTEVKPAFEYKQTPMRVKAGGMFPVMHNHQHFKVDCRIKGIVHPKKKIYWTYTLVIQEVDEFIYSSEQICRNVAFHLLLTNGSSAVNGCRQNESPNIW